MDQHFAAQKCHFLGSFGAKVQRGSIGTVSSTLLPGIDPRPDLRPQEPDIRAFAKEADYKLGTPSV
jgi:hypothetical protein